MLLFLLNIEQYMHFVGSDMNRQVCKENAFYL